LTLFAIPLLTVSAWSLKSTSDFLRVAQRSGFARQLLHRRLLGREGAQVCVLRSTAASSRPTCAGVGEHAHANNIDAQARWDDLRRSSRSISCALPARAKEFPLDAD
jgi:hypothetical protein